MAIATERLFGELSERVTTVELDCEKAAMMAEPLAKELDANPNDINASEIREAKEALRIAQAILGPTARLISGKLVGLKGAVRTKMLQLQSRAASAQALIDKATKTCDEAQSRAAAAPILQQTEERLRKVEEVLEKMKETEAPFLMGIETLPGEEGTDLLLKMDKAAMLAQSAIADAHKYVSLKMVELGKLSEESAEAARAEMERAKEQLDDNMQKVREFQVDTAKRKRLNAMEVIRGKVEDAEAIVLRLREAEANSRAASPDELKECLERGHELELEAQSIVVAARRQHQERSQDLRAQKSEMGSGKNHDEAKIQTEIQRMRARIDHMEADLAKFKKSRSHLEEKLKVDKTLADISDCVREAEMEVGRLLEFCDGWSPENPPLEEEMSATASLQTKVSPASLQLDQKIKAAQGIELTELRALHKRMRAVQDKLNRIKSKSAQITRSEAMRSVKDAAVLVEKAEARANQLSNSAAPGSKMSLPRLEELYSEASDAVRFVAEAHRQLNSALGPKPLLEAKVEVSRLQLRCRAAEKRSRVVFETLTRGIERETERAIDQVFSELRSVARQEDGSYEVDGLCEVLCVIGDQVMENHVSDYMLKVRPDISEEVTRFAMRRIAPHGLSRQGLAGALEQFMRCVREIAITKDSSIEDAEILRKLEVGEIVEILSADEILSDKLQLSRVRCRVIRDGTEGWITLKQSQKGVYLKTTSRPLFCCNLDKSLTTAMGATTADSLVRTVEAGEVVQLLEGPQDERHGSGSRVRGIACH